MNDTKRNRRPLPSRPQRFDEQSATGHMPNPEQINSNSTLDRAHKMGLYTEVGEDEPHELNIAEEVREDEQARRDE